MQKAAYEMRISDWSSDVCSSDLTGDARRCRDQIFDGAELVSRQCRGARRHLQFRDQARAVPGQAQQGVVDAGRNRLCDHLEISELRAQRRRQRRRILFGRGRSEEHTSELQSLMRISYAVFCLKKKTSDRLNLTNITTTH